MAEGVFQCQVNFLIRGSIQAQNVLSYWFADESLFGTPHATDFLNAIDTSLTSKYTALLGTTDQLVSYRLVSTAHDGDPTHANSAWQKLKNVAGTRTVTDDCPQELCILVDKQTAHVGRSFRGWMFCPPTRRSISLGTGGWLTGEAYYVAAQALVTELLRHLEGGNFWTVNPGFDGKLVVYSKTRRKRGLPDWANPVTSMAINPHPAWLRSRRR